MGLLKKQMEARQPRKGTLPERPAASHDILYLGHILTATERIAVYMQGGHHRFMVESQWQDAVMRQLEIIGEATRRLSPALRGSHPEVAWGRIVALGEALIHDYSGVDLTAVCEIAEQYIPELRLEVEAILVEVQAGGG